MRTRLRKQCEVLANKRSGVRGAGMLLVVHVRDYSAKSCDRKILLLLIHGGQIDLGTVSGRLVQANATWDRRTMRTG